jgi:hypothetical protein
VPEPSAFEFQLAIQKLKCHKSPAIDHISIELIKAGEIIGIISVYLEATGQQLTIYSAFIKCWEKMGIKRRSASALYRLKESL